MLCGLFVVGRIIFTLGYKTGNPINVRDLALPSAFCLSEPLANTRRIHWKLVNVG